jgi:hypothetical protein
VGPGTPEEPARPVAGIALLGVFLVHLILVAGGLASGIVVAAVHLAVVPRPMGIFAAAFALLTQVGAGLLVAGHWSGRLAAWLSRP